MREALRFCEVGSGEPSEGSEQGRYDRSCVQGRLTWQLHRGMDWKAQKLVGREAHLDVIAIVWVIHNWA